MTINDDAQGERRPESSEDTPAGAPEIGVGEPGPSDEAAAGIETTAPPAGAPGPGDEPVARIDPASPSVAGEPGPSDEANAALGTPVEGKE